ncbi:unnamed protein product [Urochloa humidicola]
MLAPRALPPLRHLHCATAGPVGEGRRRPAPRLSHDGAARRRRRLDGWGAADAGRCRHFGSHTRGTPMARRASPAPGGSHSPSCRARRPRADQREAASHLLAARPMPWPRGRCGPRREPSAPSSARRTTLASQQEPTPLPADSRPPSTAPPSPSSSTFRANPWWSPLKSDDDLAGPPVGGDMRACGNPIHGSCAVKTGGRGSLVMSGDRP